eukprot:15053194-Alexandrium_andersonii.AAC.1
MAGPPLHSGGRDPRPPVGHAPPAGGMGGSKRWLSLCSSALSPAGALQRHVDALAWPLSGRQAR